jgi:S-adenosylmethionine decarboxylase
MNIDSDFDSLHLMANLHGCDGSASLMRDATTLQTCCLKWVEESGLVAVGQCFHQFEEGGGVTGVVVLAESHLSVHTWPEKSFVTLDVFVCNMNCDNRTKARQLLETLVNHFQPKDIRLYEVERN